MRLQEQKGYSNTNYNNSKNNNYHFLSIYFGPGATLRARIDLEAQSVDCKRFDEERWNKSWRLREVINDSGICVVKWVGVGCGWDKGWLKSSQRIWEKVELRAHKGRFAFSTGTAPFFSARRIIYPLPFWGTSMASHSPYLNCTHRDKISH